MLRRKDVDARPKAAPLSEFAPAKVNLTLRVLGRRADGYHDIESLVAFARVGDRLTLHPGGPCDLRLRGPNAGATGNPADNLVLKGAAALAAQVDGLEAGRFVLDKRLPVAAGLGGGSADAAAALRLLARANRLAGDDPRLFAAARATGADCPVCLDPRPRTMRGIGEVLSPPLDLPSLPAVLVNPGVPIATRDVFARLGLSPGETRSAPDSTTVPAARTALLSWLADQANDLESPALALAPVIGDVLGALRALADCRLARMSGSGATCFGLFDSSRAARAAAHSLAAAHPGWWVRATMLG
jgi:4-diphosphocytidyl-2-C-methyl-D-erythritol kinase